MKLRVAKIISVEVSSLTAQGKVYERRVYKTAPAAADTWAEHTAWNVVAERKGLTYHDWDKIPDIREKIARYKQILFRRSLPIFKAMLEGAK